MVGTTGGPHRAQCVKSERFNGIRYIFIVIFCNRFANSMDLSDEKQSWATRVVRKEHDLYFYLYHKLLTPEITDLPQT